MQSAAEFVEKLKSHQSDHEYKKINKYFKSDDSDNRVIGVRMKIIFDTAKESVDMPIDEIKKLLDEPYYEARMGAVSIMDFQTRRKNINEKYRKQLFELYITRHDRLNNWDLIDRSAPRVVGWYLMDKPRDILYKLARSENIWERRTSIIATLYLIGQNDIDDTFEIAEILLYDGEELINKAVGTALRYAGQKDEKRLLEFLDKYAATMSRATLRIALEKLDTTKKKHYMNAWR
jgi:3-methyladenine DNA glycosylase AlkD